MPKKIYIVDLTKEERTYLLDSIKSGEHSARKLDRARILLLADENRADGEIAEALHTGTATVQRARRRFVEGILEGALNEQPRPGRQKKLDEKGEAILETLAHSKPPVGSVGRYNSWPTGWWN
jgi:transposase